MQSLVHDQSPRFGKDTRQDEQVRRMKESAQLGLIVEPESARAPQGRLR
jgi:hypothetical protein